MKENLPPKQGRILVAEPLLGDPNFDRSIVLLVDHNPEGSVGFVLNHPLELNLSELVVDFPEMSCDLYYGGPVQQDNMFFLHRKGELLPGSQPIGNGIYWGGEIGALKELLSAGLLQAEDIRFYLGYSGWSPGQLEEEIEQKSWLVLPGDSQLIFAEKPEQAWSDLIKKQGEDYALWHNSPDDPSLN